MNKWFSFLLSAAVAASGLAFALIANGFSGLSVAAMGCLTAGGALYVHSAIRRRQRREIEELRDSALW